jgi:hypothetical protein
METTQNSNTERGDVRSIDCSLYIVKTERHEDKGRIIETDYRILATSVIEAAEIVSESKQESEEVTSSVKASHITGLPENRYRVHSANIGIDKPNPTAK